MHIYCYITLSNVSIVLHVVPLSSSILCYLTPIVLSVQRALTVCKSKYAKINIDFANKIIWAEKLHKEEGS